MEQFMGGHVVGSWLSSAVLCNYCARRSAEQEAACAGDHRRLVEVDGVTRTSDCRVFDGREFIWQQLDDAIWAVGQGTE